MQLLSLLSSPATPATQVRAGTVATLAVTGFATLVEGGFATMVEAMAPLEPGLAPPTQGGASMETTVQGQAPDDAALAGLMQAMGLTMPAATPPPVTPTAIGMPPAAGIGAGESPAAPSPAGLVPAAPVAAGTVPPPVSGAHLRAPVAAAGDQPETGTGSLAVQLPPGPDAATMSDDAPTAMPVIAAPAIAGAGVPAALQSMAGMPVAALAATKPVEGRPAPVTDIAAGRSAPRLRSGTSTPGVPPQPAAAGETRTAAIRLPTGEVPAGEGPVVPALAAPSPATVFADMASPQAVATGITPVSGRDIAAHAVAAVRPVAVAHAPGLQLVGRIEQAVAQDQTTLTVQLDPEHLGRVEVKLDLQDGRVTAMIAAERPATLDLLQRDARLIERALQQGGLQVQPDGLHFSLREGAGQWAQTDQGRRGAQLYGQQAGADPAADPLAPPIPRSDSLVDIQI